MGQHDRRDGYPRSKPSPSTGAAHKDSDTAGS
ncbi:hypothetical protein SNOG_12809 [Parastagonospora nodorum SN15]|uniref:Uncharacterized protein n=1 Tax=Phaeosphaeria nodorum (strain SN15 / ATCC MYA-4574 / FGSC 10173) TaxID=321614 RepID=Q0U605_PHANO|nr:hypothetical protein SNOG_12809 [Parastagonospora nodorum SN15]EAT79609.1 hypothetical protein SNOG_12809 [Parastagonospora nodorum SN15]